MPSAVFAEAVTGAARRAPSRPVQPILACLQLAAGDGVLAVCAYDHEVAVRYRLRPDAVTAGKAVVSARLLAELVKTFGPTQIDGCIDGADLVLRAGRAEVSLPLMPAEDYPTSPVPPPAVGVVDGDELALALKRVNVAVDRGGHTGIASMLGIFLRLTPQGIELSATDRYQAAVARIGWQPAIDLPVQALVYAGPLMDAAEMVAGRGAVSVGVDTNLFGVEVAGRSLTSALMVGEAVQDGLGTLFPPPSPTPALIYAGDLKRHLQAVALLNTDDKKAAVLTFAPGELTVQARGHEMARGRGTATVDCQYDGDPVTIGFQPKRLLDALSALRSDSVACHLTRAERPMMVTSPDEPEGVYRHLVMPVSPRHY